MRDSGRRRYGCELILSCDYQSRTYPTSHSMRLGGKESHFFLLYLNKDAYEPGMVLNTLYTLTHFTLTTVLRGRNAY